MYYKKNENDEIIITSNIAEDGFLYTDKEIVSSYDGQRLLFKEQTETEEYKAAETEYLTKKQKDDIRQQRQREFTKYLDRSPYFFETLTETQHEELRAWRQSWLDATETFIIPERPNWLN